MKKIRTLVALLTVTLLLSGCVKCNFKMDIKKDKSMDYNITYALDTSVFGDKKAFSEEELNHFKELGYKVSEYSDGNMKGYTLTFSVDNIDDLSSTEDIEFNLSSVKSNKSNKMFKIKKGFLKNKYTAKFSFDSSESGLQSNSTLNSSNTNTDNETKLDTEKETQIDDSEKTDDLELTDTDEDNTLDTNEDYSKMMDYMDLSFSVTLPYKALNNNATSVKNDGKELEWNLASNNKKNIEFEFELDRFSIMPIIIVIGCILGGLFVIAIIVTIIMAISGGKKTKTPTPTTEIK